MGPSEASSGAQSGPNRLEVVLECRVSGALRGDRVPMEIRLAARHALQNPPNRRSSGRDIRTPVPGSDLPAGTPLGQGSTLARCGQRTGTPLGQGSTLARCGQRTLGVAGRLGFALGESLYAPRWSFPGGSHAR
jgi:hypothetical protein